MLDQSLSYLLAWGTYMLSCIGVLAVCWRITKSWYPIIKTTVRLVLVALLLTPFQIATMSFWYAPAYLVSVYESVLGNHDVAMQALTNIGVVLALLSAFTVLNWVIKQLLHHK